MSYILEALKKAEQSRLAAKPPGITSVTFSPEEINTQSIVWLYVATFAGVIACAALLGWWLSSKLQDEFVPNKVAIELPSKNYQEVPGASRELSGMSLKPVTETPQARDIELDKFNATRHAVASIGNVSVVPPASSTKSVILGNPAKNEDTFAPAVADSPVPKSKGNAPWSATAAKHSLPRPEEPLIEAVTLTSLPQAKPLPSLRVWRLDELPPEVRRNLPKLDIAGYVYSADAAGRVVSINERSFREGDELIAGLKLERIARDYVLFSFRGYRFRSESF